MLSKFISYDGQFMSLIYDSATLSLYEGKPHEYIPGHEFVGGVHEVGRGVKGFNLGGVVVV